MIYQLDDSIQYGAKAFNINKGNSNVTSVFIAFDKIVL